MKRKGRLGSIDGMVRVICTMLAPVLEDEGEV